MMAQPNPTAPPAWNTAVLQRATHPACAYSAALSAWGQQLKDALVLVYTAEAAHFARLNANAELKYAPEKSVDPNKIFELRAFNDKLELRWRQSAPGTGEAIALYEDGAATPPDGWTPGAPQSTHALDGQYLVLGDAGEFTQEQDGWTRVKDFRVNDFFIPHAGPCDAARRPAIAYREYFIAEETHGNLQFFAERLTGLAN